MQPLSDTITTGAVTHIRLTAADPARSRDFYTSMLGFLVMFESADGYLITNGEVFIGLRKPPSSSVNPADGFDPNGIGMSRLTFSVASRSELEKALVLCKLRGVRCDDIVDHGPAFGFYSLLLHDPDGIPIELSARYPQD
jgi:catechol 2,3-dioxygenase-like lactoylglutathione lyase family enzyme